MSNATVARRYAQALVDLCDERGDHDAIRKTFDRLAEVLSEVPEALTFVANPTVSEDERVKLLADLAAKADIGETIAKFSQLLLKRGRFSAILAIHEHFTQQLDSRSGRINAHVTSAAPLAKATITRLTKVLAGSKKRHVALEHDVDDALIGGLIIRVGNTVYDGSVRNHLERLRERTLAGTSA